MPASKLANIKHRSISKRLGMFGIENPDKVPRNVYEVDCDNFNNEFDWPSGHSYFLDKADGTLSPALRHMLVALDGGRVRPNIPRFICD
jgi:hypothetical protein